VDGEPAAVKAAVRDVGPLGVVAASANPNVSAVLSPSVTTSWNRLASGRKSLRGCPVVPVSHGR
jgi:hypothetical protein